jgi:hypothetical protein
MTSIRLPRGHDEPSMSQDFPGRPPDCRKLSETAPGRADLFYGALHAQLVAQGPNQGSLAGLAARPGYSHL